MHELTGNRRAEWYFSSIPQDRLELYRHDLDSLVTAIQSTGSQPVLAAYPMRFGRSLTVDDSALMAAWREYSPRATPETLLDFMWVARDTLIALGRRRGVGVVDLPPTLNGRPQYFDDVVHYSPLGAKKLAGEVARGVLAAKPARSSEARQ
jgi:hypothetical protein